MRERLSIMLVHHDRKAEGSAIDKVLGSRGWVAAARIVLHIIKDKDGQRKLLAGKTNMAGAAGLAFDVITAPDDPETGLAAWAPGELAETADDIIAAAAAHSKTPRKSDSAAAWVRAEIQAAGGALARAEALRRGKDAGYSEKMLDRVRGEAGAEATKAGGTSIWLVADAPAAKPAEESLDVE